MKSRERSKTRKFSVSRGVMFNIIRNIERKKFFFFSEKDFLIFLRKKYMIFILGVYIDHFFCKELYDINMFSFSCEMQLASLKNSNDLLFTKSKHFICLHLILFFDLYVWLCVLQNTLPEVKTYLLRGFSVYLFSL